MSEHAYVDPAKLEEFAVDLNGFAVATDNATDRLLTALSSLSRSWEDQAFDQFQQSVRGLAQTLLTFVGDAERFSVYLKNKSEEARQIHQMNQP